MTPGVEAVRGSLRGSPSIVDVRRHRNVAGGRNAGLVGDELLRRLPGATLTRAFEATGVVGGQATGEVSEGELPDRADAILTGSPWLDERESAALATLLAHNPDAVVICTGWAPEVTALSPPARSYAPSATVRRRPGPWPTCWCASQRQPRPPRTRLLKRSSSALTVLQRSQSAATAFQRGDARRQPPTHPPVVDATSAPFALIAPGVQNCTLC
ncbi:hypothetical protein [Barrientosiimonas endolithica]|uniref:Uncharacterized protein n=1 Tax=Barrientosiimonas endolithica TaxID=1535208 RepID=A0ABM8HC40_9MICO|nr:hypothetical protein [Barrientosiimonas endolithica]BDZ58523.1 hypothetical protein GCM10025872_21800 [Barrientosiimonas endolithica]